MNKDINKIFDLFHLNRIKSFEEILEDNQFCSLMRERLLCFCLERNISCRFSGDSFSLAYRICGILYLPLFREYLHEDAFILYRSLEKYYFDKYKHSMTDDDELILRSLILLILRKNTESLCGIEEIVDYLLNCMAKRDCVFAGKVFAFSREDEQKYIFSFDVGFVSLHSWRYDGGFDYLFGGINYIGHETLDKIYKYVVCPWPINEQWKVAKEIEGYFESSLYWGRYKDCFYADDLKEEVNQGMKYLENLVIETMPKKGGMLEIKDSIKNDVEKVRVVKKESNNVHYLIQGNIEVCSRGRKPESLFIDKNGGKDDAFTKQQAALFVEYLKLHKASTVKLDSKKGNYVNKAFVVFYQKWVKERIVLFPPNGNACFRFLLEDCKLQIIVGKNTYANHIRNMINKADKIGLLDIEVNVDSFLKAHNK